MSEEVKAKAATFDSEQANAQPKTEPQLDFVGMDQIIGPFADAFLLARKEDAQTIYFFQQVLPPNYFTVLRETAQVEAPQARCVAKVILSPQGAFKLVEGLATNLGLKLVQEQTEQ